VKRERNPRIMAVVGSRGLISTFGGCRMLAIQFIKDQIDDGSRAHHSNLDI
jgi:hypothetical protein